MTKTVFFPALLMMTLQASAGENAMNLRAWWVDSLDKLLVTAEKPNASDVGRIESARGEREAIQIAVRSSTDCRVTVTARPFGPKLPIRIRRVGRVPIVRGTHRTPEKELVAKAPVRLPDPLFSENRLELKADRTECFWLDVEVPADVKPGEYRTEVTIVSGSQSIRLPFVLVVHEAVIPFQGHLRLTNWFSVRPKELGFGDAPVGSEAWFASADLLFDSMWAHRQDMFWTPLRPPYIKPIADDDGRIGFDFTLFDAWVNAFSRPRGGMRKTYIEGQPIAWRKGYDGHVKARIWKIVDGKPQQRIIEVDDPDAREGYRLFLSALRDHLKQRAWLDRFRIHITDEPHRHQLKPYAVVAGYVREFAPEFRIIEALDVHDDFAFFEKNCDVWVPQLGRFNNTLDQMLDRLKAGKEVWIYTCLFPNGEYPNRFIDYPLIKTRILHWMNYRWGFTGYLHWGFNHWRGNDPFEDVEPPHGASRFLPPGDAWIVYPGRRELLDSVRHEAMRDGVEDYELLKLLEKSAPRKADELARRAVRTFTDYVRDTEAFREIRAELLRSL